MRTRPVMSKIRRGGMIAVLAAAVMLPAPQAALAQQHDDDPAALEAFTQLIDAYRQRPALTVKTKINLVLTDPQGNAGQSQSLECEMILAGSRQGIVKINDFTCYLAEGSITSVHDQTDHSYFTSPDDDSPYYAMLVSFVDLPYPHFAIGFGEESIDDLLMQFHTKAPWVRPTAVSEEQTDNGLRQKIMLTSDFSEIELIVDPQRNLIEDMTARITGGALVMPGYTLSYDYDFTYEEHEKPLDDAELRFDPGPRQRVDLMASLVPQQETQQVAQAPQPRQNQLVGQEAPNFVLATMDGGAVDLSDLRGRVVVVDFWATWCGPCVRAMPAMHNVARWCSDNDMPVTFLMVNMWEIADPDQDTPENRLASAKKFWEDKGFTLTVALDYTDEVAQQYGVTGIPSTFIIRSDGIVHAQHTGFPGEGPMKAEIEAAIDALVVDGADGADGADG